MIVWPGASAEIVRELLERLVGLRAIVIDA
jgi:hypothetical protein